MNTKARIVLTAGLGLLMGVSTWMTDWSSADEAVDQLAFLAVILVPLIVGRWWVVAALAGQLSALVALQLTGHLIQGFDNTEVPALPLGIVGLAVTGVYLLTLVGIRKAFDLWRRRRAAATNGGHAFVSTDSDS